MAYKWKPSAAQRKQFAENMKDPDYKAAREARKEAAAQKKRASSKFGYYTAGGNYTPTRAQYEAAAEHLSSGLNNEEENACNIVMAGYSLNEKVHHDFIHIVNELTRKKS